MATIDGQASLTSNGNLSVRESAIQNIATPIRSEPTLEANFTWAPVSVPYSYVIGGTVFISDNFVTAINLPITFTAVVSFPKGRYAVSYHWDLGDGTEAWGLRAHHTYTIANNFIRVTLTVTDNLRQKVIASHPLYLRDLDSLVVNPASIVLVP
jgi:hypothetical protein